MLVWGLQHILQSILSHLIPPCSSPLVHTEITNPTQTGLSWVPASWCRSSHWSLKVFHHCNMLSRMFPIGSTGGLCTLLVLPTVKLNEIYYSYHVINDICNDYIPYSFSDMETTGCEMVILPETAYNHLVYGPKNTCPTVSKSAIAHLCTNGTGAPSTLGPPTISAGQQCQKMAAEGSRVCIAAGWGRVGMWGQNWVDSSRIKRWVEMMASSSTMSWPHSQAGKPDTGLLDSVPAQ